MKAFTTNGDLVFASMGNNPAGALLELDQVMVREKIAPSSVMPRRRGRNGNGKAAKIEVKSAELSISQCMLERLDERFARFQSKVGLLATSKEQAQWWSLFFRYAFFVRNIRGKGKRERALFYYLFQKLNTLFPKTCCALVPLIPEFGYFGDLEKVMINASALSSGKELIAATISCLHQQLDADVRVVFGKPIALVQAADADTLNTRLKAMSRAELSEFTKDMKVSLVAKWLSRETRGKNLEALAVDPRELFVRSTFLNGSEPTPARLSYAHMRLRKILTALSQCSRVVEQLMCSQPNLGIKRNWADIDIASMPAGASNKYRKALLNELDGGGSRFPDRPDRVACRKNVMRSIMKGNLKGANLDLAKLCRIIWQEVSGFNRMSAEERSLISLQWNEMVSDVKKKIDEQVEAAANSGLPIGSIDPRNVIPIVDTSGSMAGANVQDIAIGLGLLATALSSTPGAMISFSKTPKAFMIDLTQDIFEQFRAVRNGPMGLSTNVDATYRLVLDMMVANKVPSADFALLILTDGQFNSGLVQFERGDDEELARGVSQLALDHFQTVFLERMEKAFQEKGFSLPRTVFWNLNSRVPGFPADEHTRGVQLVSGFSQDLMEQVFTGDYPVVATPEQAKPESEEIKKPEAAQTEPEMPEPEVVQLQTAVNLESDLDTVGSASPPCELAEEEQPSPARAAPPCELAEEEQPSPARADVTPWRSFVRVLTSDTFDSVLRLVLQTGEGVFSESVVASSVP